MFRHYRKTRPGTKRELIDTLSDKPPRSFAYIRKVLRRTVKIIRQEVSRIEKEYIGDKKDLCSEIRSWMVPLKAIMRGMKISELTSSRQIDSIMSKVSTPGSGIPVDPLDLVRLRDCLMKVREYVPFKFNRSVDLTQKSLKILQKFCLSFYDMVNDPPLGTAYDYHTNSISIADKVKELLEKCRMMSFKFQTEVVTLKSNFFGSNARQIAARCECEGMPFLVMFPQVCDNMKEIASLLERWIDADENYADFIRHDIEDIDQKRQKLVQKTRDCQENCWHLAYKLKLAEQDAQVNTKELAEWKGKSALLLVEEEMVQRELNDRRIDLEIKEFKKAELVRNRDDLDPGVYQEQLDTQNLDVRKVRDEVKHLTKKLENVQHRLNRAEERIDLLVSRDDVTLMTQLDLTRAEKEREEAEIELSAVMEKLDLAKKIHTQKTSVEMLEKIHYSLPLVDIRSPRYAQSEEIVTFDRICDVTANHIGGDWNRLYRFLPFVPSRGKLQIEVDIENIVQSNPRDNHYHHALRSLQRWRRFNNRAKADDLLDTLKRIKRYDVVDVIDYTLHPPVVHEKVEETPPPTFLANHLIPCYKEVERFDQLRAANRIPPLGWERTRLIL